FSSCYGGSLVVHRAVGGHLGWLPLRPIKRDTARATLTVNGPASSLRRTSVSRNCDVSRPKSWRNSGTTPCVMVFLVKGWAISSALWALANSIKGEYLRPQR